MELAIQMLPTIPQSAITMVGTVAEELVTKNRSLAALQRRRVNLVTTDHLDSTVSTLLKKMIALTPADAAMW